MYIANVVEPIYISICNRYGHHCHIKATFLLCSKWTCRPALRQPFFENNSLVLAHDFHGLNFNTLFCFFERLLIWVWFEINCRVNILAKAVAKTVFKTQSFWVEEWWFDFLPSEERNYSSNVYLYPFLSYRYLKRQ